MQRSGTRPTIWKPIWWVAYARPTYEMRLFRPSVGPLFFEFGRVGQCSVAERNPPSGNEIGGLRCADPPYEMRPIWPSVCSVW